MTFYTLACVKSKESASEPDKELRFIIKCLYINFNRNLQENQYICTYPGESISYEEMQKRLPTMNEDRKAKLICINRGGRKKNLWIDAVHEGMGQYFNHICRHLSNCRTKIIKCGSQEKICFFAKRIITKNEEICWEYDQVNNRPKIEWAKCYCKKNQTAPVPCYLYCQCNKIQQGMQTNK